MRLLASTDFALRTLMQLAAEPDRQHRTEDLAQAVGVPRNHLQKVVQTLAAFGLVRTMRGAHGGVVLARSAGDISLGAVVRLLERDQALVECFRSDGGACCLTPACRLRGFLATAREAFFASLDGLFLADCLAGTGGLSAARTVPHSVG